MTAQQPYNNISRVTLQALAAVLGGTQSLHTNSFDEALALPTEQSAEIALRTQQIIAYESGVADSVDPLAGSYLIESLTDEIEAHVLDYLKRIDDMGGAIRAIEAGYFQNEIASSAYRYQRSVEANEKIIVGVNEFTSQEHGRPDILVIGAELEKEQVEKIRALRNRRDNTRVRNALTALEQAARSSENVVPRILAAVEAYATLGEIADTLRKVFGEYRSA